MKRFVTAVGLMAMLVSAAAVAQQKQDFGPVVVDGIKTATFSSTGATLSGPNLYMATKDGKFEVKAPNMVLTFATGNTPGGVGSLKTAKLTGGVWIKSEPEKGRSIEGSADTASVDYAIKQEVVLTGNVTVKNNDPQRFIGPAVATGDRAAINLTKGDQRFTIESLTDKAKIEFTLRPQETTAPGQDNGANKD